MLVTATIASTPPRVETDGLGRSAPTSARKVGAASGPETGPDQMVLATWVAKVAVRVPEEVIGETVIVKTAVGKSKPTDVTVPRPAGVEQVGSLVALAQDRT